MLTVYLQITHLTELFNYNTNLPVFTLAGCYFGTALYGILIPALSEAVFQKDTPSRKNSGTWFE